jgi:nifR3 family TIM-barrel protein
MSIAAPSFWSKLPKPFFCLAPMADVTDAAFRRIIAKYGKPDVTWTEFVSVDGLCSPGREVLLRDFLYTEGERPIVAQIFGSTPDNFFTVAQLIRKLGFDGIDINMGCPDRNIEKQGGGAAMMKTPELAQEVIRATQEGGGGLPVSVKTRVGFNQVELETWIPKLLETKPAAITIHARTRKELSNVPARWGHVKEVVEMAKGSGTLIIGNGDVRDIADARQKAEETGADGVMLGRAIFGNPWLFIEKIPTIEEKLRVMVEHTKLFHELLGDVKNFAVMKKHYKAYVNGFDGAKELRVKLMDTETPEEVEEIVQGFLGASA